MKTILDFQNPLIKPLIGAVVSQVIPVIYHKTQFLVGLMKQTSQILVLIKQFCFFLPIFLIKSI